MMSFVYAAFSSETAKAYEVLTRGIFTLRNYGTYFCIQLPLQILSFCIQLQISLLSLPFYGLNAVFKRIHGLWNFIFRRKPKPSALLSILGCDNDDTEEILRTMKEIRMNSMAVLSKMNSCDVELEKYREKLNKWKKESSRKTGALYVIASEEKKLMRVITGALKHLRKLKSAREMMDKKFNSSFRELLNLSKNICNQSSPIIVENGPMKDCYNVLCEEADQIKATAEAKRNANSLEMTDMKSVSLTRGNGLPTHANAFQDSRLLSLTMDTMHTVINMITVENSHLNKRLLLTNDKLEEMANMSNALCTEILNLSHQFSELLNLNQSIRELQKELEQGREMLRLTEADRDELKEKLLILQNMIEEEEDYLNDEFSEGTVSESNLSSQSGDSFHSEEN